ncbi:MAG: right-handed parallel beta-helix repeat-containing protein [Candidatus Cloacimonetes bacterium]|nr:right-handed parallel beta-helix repeat-containing protein [Candidatus Cloacimonadota bacterium]
MKYFFIFLIVCFTTTIFALDHSGTISSDEYWDNSHNHYIVGDVTVSNGVTLTIEAGSLIKFYAGCGMNIYGTLIANGTNAANITFTSRDGGATPGFWEYIYFNSADPGCILDYCDIYYGGSSNGILYLNNSGSNVQISNCDIEFSGTNGFHLHGTDSQTVTNCVIDNNVGHGIYCASSDADPIIANCEINSNGECGVYGATSSTITISDCSIQNNGSYAIKTYARNIINITGSMNILGNTNNSIYVLAGQTYDSGTWLNHGVPYIIGGDVTIYEGRTITFSEGITLKFDDNYCFRINGRLIANGTSDNHITFTSNQATPSAGDWKNIYFYISSDNCSLSYCDIFYAGSSYGAVYGYYSGSNVTISDCTIQYSATKGIYLYDDDPVITNCVINDNGEHGIYCTNYSNPVISDCSIQNNGSYAIRIYAWSIVNITGNMTISGNTNNSIYVLSGQTNVSGTWFNHGVPYIIGGDVTIYEGRTITFSEGITLKFNGNYYLNINGRLIANGTSENHITFTSNQTTPSAGNWQNLFLYNSDAGCSLNYCDILYGGSDNGVIYGEGSGSNVSFSFCSIRYSGTKGFYLYDSPTIADCTISDNMEHGIYCVNSSGNPAISDCTIQNNGDYAIRTYGNNVKNITGNMTISGNTKNSIYVAADHIENGMWNYHGVPYVIGGNLTIDQGDTCGIAAGNTLKFNGDHYIYVRGLLRAYGTSENRITFTSNQENPTAGDWKNIFFYYSSSNCLLDYCDILYGGSETDRGAIYIDETGDHVTLNNCNIEYSQYAGIFLWANSAPSIINCAIKNNNQYGIRIYGSSSHPSFGSNLSEWNDIYDNNGGGVGRSFRNSTTNNTAEYIYWGTTDETEINNLIYDDADNSSLGVVDYTPWTNTAHDTEYPIVEPDSPQNVIISIVGTEVQIAWSAVSGATSYKVYSSNDPNSGFEEDITGTYDGESWSASVPYGKMFYYVKAGNLGKVIYLRLKSWIIENYVKIS